MTPGQTVLLQCQISASSFSGERIFRITLTNQSQHVGVAAVNYCHRGDQSALSADEPSKGKQIEGFVEGRVIKNGGNQATVGLPDGESVTVPLSLISFVKEEIKKYVPV